ncbi:hypothetical protein Godav_015598, partial [Gossypium davidsonii]|nr:hypothetical protein [Gossypium davidsonii]
QEPVVKRGEELIKRKASGANLDDLRLISRLFLLFTGTTGAENTATDLRVNPGNATLKVKLMASKLDQLKLMGPLILNGIMKLLDGYSNSEPGYLDKIEMATRLFHALKVESQSLRFIIQEATNSLAAAYMGASAAVLTELESLLLNNCQVEESEVRFCALRWATSVFDSQHCPSRFICMLGAADSRLDIREIALEGLFLGKDAGQIISQNLDHRYPKLGEMLDYILKQQPKLLDSYEMREQKLLFPSKMYVAMIKFLLKCFESELVQNSSLGRSSEFLSSVERMCLLLEHAMAFEGSVELHSTTSKALVTIGSYLPEMVSSHFASRISWLKHLLSHVDMDTRESVARLLGIASSSLPVTASSDIIRELVSLFSGTNKRFEVQHGALCATGFVTADCVSRSPSCEVLTRKIICMVSEVAVACIPCNSGFSVVILRFGAKSLFEVFRLESLIQEELLQNTLKCLVDVVNSESATLASISMQALGHIGLSGSLPSLVCDSSSVSILELLNEKLSKLLSGDDNKAVQKIVISIGHMCVKETSASNMKIALDLIFSLCRSKVEDILFAAGEALSFIWGGVPVTADVILKTNYTSLSMTSNFLMGDTKLSLSKYSSDEKNVVSEDCHMVVRDTISKKLFDALLYSSRKEERCAGTVWLLSLTMYCGDHPTIQQMLPEIQEAFSFLLGEQNELTQELASQGMSIVYDLGDTSMKKNLVDALVTTLTGSGKRKRAIKLVEDSEVFQEGTIGESLSGGKLSTYKELCNLANEMGQPDLIYKFMDLANYQASLNSKRGAAFGFSKIAKQAGDALQPHLRLLIPRLVRYQYDPDKNVQDAMAHIWKSLVADPKRTIDENLDYIFDDLLVQCGSRLWRSREAACLALADIIQGRKFDQVGKHLKKIWLVAFRAMDDIKETVRTAGDKLCRAITSLTIRLCDVSLTEAPDASQSMDIVLPFLLAEGILSKVDSIRKASIGVVMKLAKGAGVALRPHLSDLVCCMLESLSSLEDQGLNYVELHAANVGIQTEKLENLRLSIAKGSPMWETLDLCINVVDGKSLELLVPRLANLVRSGVGLNTRLKVVVGIRPYSNMLLRSLFPVVKEEKSTAAKRAFAGALAIVLKHSTPSQAQELIEDTAALHTGDRNAQISCVYLLKSFSSIASDVLSGYNTVIIPVIFTSRCGYIFI